jgi:hypothetical protein
VGFTGIGAGAAALLLMTLFFTIHAPAERIWPWLVQVGYGGRAGFYSYDLLERRFGARNTDRFNPDLPALAVGELVPLYPDMPMTVAIADPPHALVLWLVTSANKAIDPTRPWPREHVAWSWAFVLEPVDANTTRLLTPDAHHLPAHEPARPLDLAGVGVTDLRLGQAPLGVVGARRGALTVDVDVQRLRPGGDLELAGCGVRVAHGSSVGWPGAPVLNKRDNLQAGR